MTTKFPDNKICTFEILLSWRYVAFPTKKTAFRTIFLSAPNAPPPQNRKLYFYCRVAVSDHSCTRVRRPSVALHVSQQISREVWGFSDVAAVSRYTPPTGPCRTCRP